MVPPPPPHLLCVMDFTTWAIKAPIIARNLVQEASLSVLMPSGLTQSGQVITHVRVPGQNVEPLLGYLDVYPSVEPVASREPDSAVWGLSLPNLCPVLAALECSGRQSYCCRYEALARPTAEYAELARLHACGENLRIVGEDGHTTGVVLSDKTLEDLYFNTTRPFGHGLVLRAMLTMAPMDLPWRH
jgi:hypothetical protein